MNNQNLNQEQKDTSMGAIVVWGIILLVAAFIVYQVAFKKDNAAILDTVSKDVFVVKTEQVQKRDLKHQLITDLLIRFYISTFLSSNFLVLALLHL